MATRTQHVIPVDDERPHDLSSWCWCCPDAEPVEESMLYVHHAADLREARRDGRALRSDRPARERTRRTPGDLMTEESQEGGYSLVVPFLIDGGEYTEREQYAFVLGWEFCDLRRCLDLQPGAELTKTVHADNEDRMRVLCQRMGRECVFEHLAEGWKTIRVYEHGTQRDEDA
jgi:hypothetical protein